MKPKSKLKIFNEFCADIQELLNNLSIETTNYELYLKAFTHPSFANEHHLRNNERLEFLGDAILDFLVGEFLFKKYPHMPEGDMSKTRSQYVCAQANAEYSKNLKLDKFLLLGRGEEEQGGRAKPAVLGDLFESFLGALYLDQGIDKVRELLESHVYPQIEYEKTEYFADYKSKLQEYTQAKSRNALQYHVEAESGPAHDKRFEVGVYHDGIKLGHGYGKSKKEAEQVAAHDALSKLKV